MKSVGRFFSIVARLLLVLSLFHILQMLSPNSRIVYDFKAHKGYKRCGDSRHKLSHGSKMTTLIAYISLQRVRLL